MKLRTVLFDLDGTLTDPGEGITNSVAYALERFGISVVDKKELYSFIGPPLVESFRELYAFTAEQAAQAVAYYREYFAPRGIFENRMYDGIRELLTHLREHGIAAVLATSKPEPFAVRILEHFGLTKFFAGVYGSTLSGARTRKDEVIAYALECAGIDPAGAMMVGDRKHDILGAHANGLPAIGVLYGYGTRAELEAAGADFIAPTVAELEQLLLSKGEEI